MQDWSNSFTPGNTYVKDADGNYVFAPGGRAGVPGQTTYGNHEGSSNAFSFTQPNPMVNASFGAGTSQAAQAAQAAQVTQPTARPASSGAAFGGGTGSAQQQNPYLTQMGDALTQQVTSNLSRNILPQIRSQAQAVGGFGGSRQGVVEANALNDANQGISNALASLYGTDWTNAQNRGLQQQSLDNSYNLGLGNLGLGAKTAENNFYTAQRGQDLQSYGLGAQLVQSGNQGYINGGQGVYNIGSTEQQAPWNVMNNNNNVMNPWAGNTGTTSGSISSSPAAGFIGGALGGAQLYNNWNSGQNNPYAYTNQSGFSNTPNYMVR